MKTWGIQWQCCRGFAQGMPADPPRTGENPAQDGGQEICDMLKKKILRPCRISRSPFVGLAERSWGPPPNGRKNMRVMVIVKATEDSEAGKMPPTELIEAMGKFNEQLVNAGIMLDGDGLKPSSAGKRVAFDGASRQVIDGPFAETRELVAGYWVWEVKDMAEAVEWVKRCPNPMPGPSEIEIRPFFEAADFGEAFTPELIAAEQALRDRMTKG
jgi:hypothetical protein